MLSLLLSWFPLSDAHVSSLWDLSLFAGSRREIFLTSEVMTLAWAIYLCGPQHYAQHMTCQRHLDAQFCTSSNFTQCQSMPGTQPSSLDREEEYGQQCPCCFACAWLSCIVMDNGRWRFSSQNTPVFLCWQEWFPAQWIAQAQKRTTENYIESLLQIWSIAVRR